MKNEHEIRKMLGDRYHLTTKYDFVLDSVVEWRLFKTYKNGDPIYYSNDNKVLMSNETHTEEDLFEFAKSHKKFDVFKTHIKVQKVIISIILLMSLINIFIGLRTISIIVLTCYVMLLIWLFTNTIIFNKNYKVDVLETFDNWKRFRDIRDNEVKK